MGKLDGKVALITGAGRGIGKGIALRFAAEGADIVVNALQNVTEMEATAAEVRALGREAIAVKADVSRKDEVEAMAKAAIDTFKKIDILVNNAGITRPAPLTEMSEADWDSVLDVDLKGVFLCTQAVARHMIKEKYGKIINISSTAGFGAANEQRANYGAAKAGVIGLTKITAKALGKYGINVNAIAPGMIMTDIAKAGKTPAEYEAFVEDRKRVAILGRVGQVEDIAAAALFLASDESSFITAQVISVDGGRLPV